jgi:transposase
MSHQSRRQALDASGLTHPRPEAVTAGLFIGDSPFFFPLDKVQVKYEMLRAHFVDDLSVTAAAQAHGYSRAEFYLVAAAFEESGMAGLVDGRRGRKGPTKLAAEVRTFLDGLGPCSAADAADQLEASIGVRLHPRSIQRVRHQ